MKYGIFFLFLGLLCSNLSAQSTHSPLRKGDRAYDREQYKSAEKQYRIAADRDMGNPQALYNLGNTLYQQGNFEDAQQRFKQAAEGAVKTNDKADAFHNLGDSFLKQRKYKEAVQAYEQSLRLRPADEGTKQNLQMAKKRLREEEQKEKEKKDQQQQQQQNQQQPNPQDQQNPQQNPQNQQDKPQEQPNQPEQNPTGQPQQPKPEQTQKQEEQRLKKEDAKRLLETAIGPDDRKNAKKYRAAQQQSKPKGPRKDW